MRIEIDSTTGCWNWRAGLGNHGYGLVSIGNGHSELAHRAAYRLFVGPILAGLEIDHLCRNRRCVNPAHLEAVTPRVNQLRGTSPAAENFAKTHCKRGHAFDARNTYITPRGDRQCRKCRAAAERTRRRRSQAQHQAIPGR